MGIAGRSSAISDDESHTTATGLASAGTAGRAGVSFIGAGLDEDGLRSVGMEVYEVEDEGSCGMI